MKVTVRVFNSSAEIFQQEDCFEEAKNLSKGSVATLAPVQGAYRLPPTIGAMIPGSAHLFIEAEGKGGLHPDGKVDAQVVCGLSGKPLRPFHVVRGGSLTPPNDVHALFSVPDNIVVIRAEEDGRVAITKHSIVLGDGDVVSVQEEQIYHGFPQNLSGWKSKYQVAAQACARKGQTMNCRSAHYVAPRRRA